MKKSVCLYFQIHHPERLRKYHFFDIGKNHNYFDDYANRSELEELAQKCYLPSNSLMKELIERHNGSFKVAFSISGSAIEQLEMHVPEVIRSFQELSQYDCVEFLAETYSHSLASLSDDTDEFEQEVKKHSALIKQLFGKKPTTFRNTSLIYSDAIGERVARLGFRTILTEGAKQVLGWKSPNFVYRNPTHEKLHILLKNSKLSDDIAIRFSEKHWNEYPLTADKFANWIAHSLEQGNVVNLFMNYDCIGYYNNAQSGIFDFLKYLPQFLLNKNISFLLPKEVAKKHKPTESLSIPFPISWTDEERDITSWLGNELQKEAFHQLFKIQPLVKKKKKDASLQADYSRLQASEHFFYMRTKLFSNTDYHKYASPYDSPYEAFINYMNILSDFIDRIETKQ